MKKIGLLCASVIATFTLAAVQTTSTHHALTNGSVVMAAPKGFSKQNYAVMAYLKYTKQDLTNVQDHSVKIENDDGKFEIDNANDKDFDVIVNNANVTLKTTDQHGKRKSHTYSKDSLEKQFSGQQDKLNSVTQKD